MSEQLKKIVIGDDEPDILKVIVFRLKKEGFEVVTATDGQQALDCVYTHRPDVILLDLRMPVMDGDQVCKQIKARSELAHIPVLLVTASSEMIREIVAECGADGWMLKPFDPVVLIEKVKSLARGS